MLETKKLFQDTHNFDISNFKKRGVYYVERHWIKMKLQKKF